jgi:hypothetical protein
VNTAPRRLFANTRFVAFATAVTVTLLGIAVGSAYAMWSSTGHGSAAVSAAGAPSTVHVIGVTAGNNPSTSLVPASSGDLVVELNNPNTYPVTIIGIAQNGDVATSGGSGAGTACAGGSSGNTGVSVPTNNALSVSVASGSAVVVHIPSAVSMSSSSASGCQGASFQIPVTLTVQR